MPDQTPQSPNPVQGGPGAQRPSLVMFALLAAMFGAMWLWNAKLSAQRAPDIDYSAFYAFAAQGKISSVVIEGQDIQGKFKAKEKIDGRDLDAFHAVMPRQDDLLLPLLRDKQVRIRVASDEQPFVVSLLSGLLPFALMIGVWVWLSRRAQRMGPAGPLAGFLKGQTHKFERDPQVGVKFDDVAGLASAKRDLQEIVGFLKEPDRFKRLGGKVPRGVLLIGPPGTGKTLLARAVAGESGVPFYSISASEFIEMFVGVGAARVRDLFAEAKKNAPSIVFIDEIDAVGRSRGSGFGGGHDEREQTLNQLLSEMDGFARNDLTVVIAATNRPDVLDSALLRPGRFDRRVIVDRPEYEARRSILGVHTRQLPLAKDVDLDVIARNAPGFSGADLANLANEAALGATRRGADEITAADFTTAYDKVVLGDVRESKLDPAEKRRVAVHESGHAIAAHFVEHGEPLHRVSIIPRGMALGATQQTPGADRHLMTEPELESRLTVLMGGFAAERIVLGSVSTGAENDLKEATKIATKMVANYGMSEKLGAVYYEHESEHPFLGQRIATDSGASEATISAIESEARAVLAAALQSATETIERNRARLDRLVDRLMDQETLEGADLVELLGSRAARTRARESWEQRHEHERPRTRGHGSLRRLNFVMETTPAVVSHRFLLDHQRLEVLLVQLLAAFTASDHEAESRLWQECSSGIRSHLEAEETHLIPALRRLSERDARVVVQEHQHIRTCLAEVGAGIDSRSVRLETVRDFIDELRAHAQSEDRLLYRWADSHLDEQELASAVDALVTV